jgi:4-hydroxymandelate oxidase
VTAALAAAGGRPRARGAGAVRAAQAECEVYADGGVSTGEHVLAALAMGAAAVFIGRPVLWALACDGADGVRRFLAGLTADLAHCMALAGAARVTDIAGLSVG